ncbi:demethoxyubiquinone hydroxylase family protein [Tepidicaulis sp. LMO-SS28]|uniref:demethoxyubiquinone hydroxylase family protein n=1 Tax=Tepidicaulis sp. LMO-SS28 TaxID=3447455 RepID=UPI003EE1B9A1
MSTAKKTRPAKRPPPAHPGAARQDERIHEMLRVDHAGEYGAVRIYAGQRAVFRSLSQKGELNESLARMEAEEREHLDRFNAILNERHVRPTALSPFWHVAGYALGAATALMGEKAAHACTVAVEEVIDDHYAGQIRELEKLGEKEKPLTDTIAKFREEEIAHRDEALSKGAKETPGYPLLSGAIKAACRFAIRASEKV